MRIIKFGSVLLLILSMLAACGGDTDTKVEISGSLTLWGDASTHPAFSENCVGAGDYQFVKPGTRIKVTSGEKVKYDGKLADARGGEREECDFPFSGSLTIADSYSIELTGDGEVITTMCDSSQVPVHKRGSVDDIAFMHLRITDDGLQCTTPPV